MPSPASGLRGVIRVLSVPTEALIRVVAPRGENVVWEMLLRQQRRGALRWSVLPFLVGLAVVTPLFAGIQSPWTIYLAIALMMVASMVFISILRPPTQVLLRYRKTGCSDHMLTAPIGASDYADAFMRTFLAAMLELVVVASVFASSLLLVGEWNDLESGVVWFVAGLLGISWIIYWVALRGGLVQLLPLFYLLAFLQAIRGVVTSGNGDWLMLFMKLSVVVFWIGGFAIYLWCRRDYADLLRRRLFR